ncbi:MAG TPA: site-specific integrase [Solirubrobacteraceae bacterium]|jgi:integrase|nr:site-specific integrase [Solirubrobacteraceae bacterium]
MAKQPKPEKGVEVRFNADGVASYRGHVWLAADKKLQRGPWFPTITQARDWRTDNLAAARKGTLRAPTAQTVRNAAGAFVTGMKDASVLDRAGKPYKPSTIRNYEGWLDRYVLPELGDKKLSDVRRADVQDLVDKLIGSGLAGSTVRNALDPFRRIMHRALRRDVITIDPTDGIDWPSASKNRDRVASPTEAAALIAAVPESDRALWATAMYAGLRAGELRALRAGCVDLDAGVIHVVAGWDDQEGEIEVKSRAGVRTVPIIAELRPILIAHLMATGRRGRPDALVFGRTDTDPFLRSTPRNRARKAWTDAKLDPITLHECRHTYASTMVAAGVDPGEVMRRMVHSTVAMTLDRYTHGIKGNEADTAEKMQSFIERSRGKVVGKSDHAVGGAERS